MGPKHCHAIICHRHSHFMSQISNEEVLKHSQNIKPNIALPERIGTFLQQMQTSDEPFIYLNEHNVLFSLFSF